MTGFCRFFTIAFSIQLSKSSRLFAASLAHCWEGNCTFSSPHGPGGDERIRTADPLLAKQVLSQLSYIPTGRALSAVHQGLAALPARRSPLIRLVGLPGFEPGTSRLSSVRSNQLS